jgi:hypothetical protein
MNWFMKIFLRHSASAMVLLSSCITPLDISTSFHEQLVVEGMITDQPGPYVVKLSKTIPVQSQGGASASLQSQLGAGAPAGVSGAMVVIKDDQGNSETLVEKSSGYYYTSTLHGVVGRTYTLSITTSEGSVYNSASEKLSPVGDFANLRFEFAQNEPAFTNHQVSSTNGFNIFIDSQVLPEQQGRVWWRTTGTFEIFTRPEFHKRIVFSNPPQEPPLAIPDPPVCSGYVVSCPYPCAGGFFEDGTPKPTHTKLFGPLRPCECCTCWVTQYNTNPIISDLKFVNSEMLSNYKVGFIEVNRRTFYNKYYLEVEQLSASDAIFNFWKSVLAQKRNSSNLFQTPPPKTGGNISAATANALPVIGYFAASSVKKHAIVINREDVPYTILPIDTIALSCTEAYKNSSTKKPLFW